MSITELGYVRFGVSDLEAWRTFAEEFIGLEVHPESEGLKHQLTRQERPMINWDALGTLLLTN